MIARRALLFALVSAFACAAFACADGSTDAGAPAAAPRAESPSDTAPAQFTAVQLPDDFPAGFPIPPGAVPVGASVDSNATGTLAAIELVDPSGVRETIGWLRDALTDLGWTVTDVNVDSTSAALQADRGESYVELTAEPTSAGPVGDDRTGPWLYIEAEIWTTSP